MEKSFKELYDMFLKIKDMDYIKTLRPGSSGVGYTFERLIGKTEENFPIPDFKDIEIKTSRRNSWGKIHLFHATPDGDYLFPIKDIIAVLGYSDKNFPKYKVFNFSTNAKEYKKIKDDKKLKINVDRQNKKIYLVAKDNDNNDLNLHISWSFELLEQRLNLKLKNLAIIKAATKKINKEEYFKYNGINFYKLKNFETFIDLIEEGIIDITFMIGIHKSGKRFGQTHDRGTAFTINEKKIELLYDKVMS